MPADCVVALDAGTSGARCAVLRAGKGLVAVARREWSYDTPPEIAPLGRSIDADAFWTALCDVTRRALRDGKVSARDVAAVGITSQRLAVLVVDEQGRALYAGPNSDVRALAEGLAIDAEHGERVYASGGKLPSLLLAPARVQWLRNRHPDAFARAKAVLTLGDWAAFRLTGELRSERTLAADCGLLDVSTGERDPDLLRALDVPETLLPPLVSAGETVGETTNAAARETGLAPGTPVVIAGSDTQCALLGLGVGSAGEVGIATGWSCPLLLVTNEPRLDAARRTWLCRHVVPGRWAVESSAADAGRAWRWWSETLLGTEGDPLEQAGRLAGQAAPGAAGVLALLGPGKMNAGAMGLHLGGLLMTTPLVSHVGRPELLRAGLENIAFALRANFEQAQEVAGLRATRIALGGGLTRAPVFASVVASALGAPVDVARDAEASAHGAALLAAREAGLPEDGLASPVDRVEPDAAALETYAQAYERWRRLGEALDALREELP